MKRKILLSLILSSSWAIAGAQVSLIFENFDSLTAETTLFTGAKYDFTSDKAFALSDTTPNTFGLYAGSNTNYVIKADPLDASNNTIWLSGSDNHSNDGRGFYFMRLDATGGGAYTSGSVTINYSFRIMRDGTNAGSPSAFDIAYISSPSSLDDGSQNMDMFRWTGETVVDSFTTSGDSDTWVSVSGSIVADLINVDTTSPYYTGIRIDPTNGAFVTGSGSPGLYYLDDISVSLVPEPATYVLLTGIAMLGLVLVRRRLR